MSRRTSTTVLIHAKQKNTDQYFIPIFDKAIELSETTKIIKKRQGRSPTSVAASCFYLASLVLDLAQTQKDVAQRFEVSETSVGKFYRLIAPKHILCKPRIRPGMFKVKCEDCTHLGEVFDEREDYLMYNKTKLVSYGLGCVADTINGTNGPRISNVRSPRICHKFDQKRRYQFEFI